MSRRALFSALSFNKNPLAQIARTTAGGLLMLSLAGCASTSTPSLSQGVLGAGAKHGATAGDLASGHRIYTTQCTACHTAQPIQDHSISEWRGIVEDMGNRAHLSSGQKSQLLAYITAAHEAAQ